MKERKKRKEKDTVRQSETRREPKKKRRPRQLTVKHVRKMEQLFLSMQ